MSRNNIISILSASFFYFGALIIREVHTLIFSPFKKSILFFLMVIIASISIALPYRSFQSGTFNELNTWEYLDGSTWNPAIALPDTDDDVFIQSGHIVNISSLFGLTAQPTQSAYNATKFAVRGFTEALRQELDLQDCGVSATCVHPGGIRTNIANSARMSDSIRS
jgi:NAD(P)-dependent dehydrogenase (short-subunit alcohol dehydrogenase family)